MVVLNCKNGNVFRRPPKSVIPEIQRFASVTFYIDTSSIVLLYLYEPDVCFAYVSCSTRFAGFISVWLIPVVVGVDTSCVR